MRSLIVLLLAALLLGSALAEELQAWTCGSSALQGFALQAAGANLTRLALQSNTTLFVGLAANSTNNCTLSLVPGGGSDPSTLFEQLAGGLLRHAASGRCMRVNGNRTATVPVAQPGAPVELAGCPGGSPPADFVWAPGAGSVLASGLPGLCLDAGTSVSCATLDWGSHAYCNTSLPLEARVADFVARLSISDAVPLMNRLGGVPRLGLPPVFYYEALHGVRSASCLPSPAPGSTGCATSFPAPIALGATFSRALWASIAGAISTEARALYNLIGAPNTATLAYYAPNLNPFFSPVWGRGQEVPSEDPTVTAEYGVQYIRGMQEGSDPRYVKVVATLKHYLAYTLEAVGGTTTTRYNFNANISAHDLALYHMPPMVAAAQRGQALSAMCSYNALNGVPMCANSHFNTALLRGAYGWQGVMGSDCGAVTYLLNGTGGHNATSSPLGMVELAVVQGGCDIACDGAYSKYLAEAVQAGVVPAPAIAASLTRLLTLYTRLGLLDPPGASLYSALGAEAVDTQAHRALAQQAAAQAATLLVNRVPQPGGRAPALPLTPSTLTSVAIIGPHANATVDMQSNYYGLNTYVLAHSPLAALTAALRAAGVAVTYAPGCADILCNSSAGFPAAAAAAAAADATLLFLGINAVGPFGHFQGRVEGEGLDRTALGLPGLQAQLVSAVRAAVAPGRPLVGVLLNGGPVAVEGAVEDALDALLEAYYPGQGGGEALAEVLLGGTSPSGRLPYTVYPANFTQSRSPLDMSLQGGQQGITYLYYSGQPLWPFGFGLSYTNFSYQWVNGSSSSGLSVSTGEVLAGLPPLGVQVTNTGAVASDVSVLAFWSSSLPGAPLSQLFDFGRAGVLGVGESATLYFTLPPALAASVQPSGERVLQACTGTVTIGSVARSRGELAGALARAEAVQRTVTITGSPVLLEQSLLEERGPKVE